MNGIEVSRASVAAADEFLSRRLWQRFANDDLLAFEIAGQPLMVGSIMGAAGQEHGLLLLLGDRALADFAAMEQDGQVESVLWSVSLERIADILPPLDRILKQAGRTGRTGPVFLVKEPGLLPRAPRRAELEVMLLVLRGLLTADDQGRLRPEGDADSGLLPVLTISGQPKAPGVKIRLASFAVADAAPLAKFTPPAELAALPRLSVTHAVAVRPVPAVITGEDREVHALLVVDVEAGRIATVDVLVGRDPAQVAESLFATFRGTERSAAGLPARLVFADARLHAMVGEGLAALGIACEYQSHVPALEAVADHLTSWLAGESPPGAPGEPPASDDLDGWKQLDRSVSERIGEAVGPRALQAERPLRRYFDLPPEDLPFDDEDMAKMVLGSYIEWYFFDWRATARSRTLAERELELDLAPGLRAVLQARTDARPSLYRVESIEQGDSVGLVDVLGGGSVRAHDRSLSLSVRPGLAFFARVYPVGDFHFASIAGPVLDTPEIEEALSFLAEECGLRVCDSVPAEGAHLLGRLWEWRMSTSYLDRVRLTNTDGEDLRGRKASFHVADPAALAAALAVRGDIEVSEAGASWNWCRGDLHLGSLELFEHELLLEVNSAERLAAARAWLVQLPGVEFVNDEPVELDPRRAGRRPTDDRLPASAAAELDAEGLAKVQEVLNARFFGWLDESIPALGGLTPRQACRTADGRAKVARLIRTYPEPMGIPGIVVPREEMMRRLGLDGAQASD